MRGIDLVAAVTVLAEIGDLSRFQNPRELKHEPIHVGRPPRLLARIMSPEPKHERGDLLALAFEVFPRRLTGAREISHRLMPLVGHPDRGEFPGAQ
jgi:hypothetical protein